MSLPKHSSRPQGPVLVVFAHPALGRSRVNRTLIDAADGLRDVTIRDLYELYPEFDVDPRSEQEQLSQHDIVVFHFPFHWYSTPALLKQWQDLVLEHGWAYGSRGDALAGKWAMAAITTGGSESSYRADGSNRYSIAELLRPLEQTAALCQMRWLPPFVVHGTHQLSDGQIVQHARSYRQILIALREGVISTDRVAGHPRINLGVTELEPSTP